MARRILIERVCFESEHLGRWCWNTYLNLDLMDKLKRLGILKDED